MAVMGDRPCSSSPVRAARSQQVLVGVKLHHVDRPCVARELGHHLASSQIPELKQGRLEVDQARDLGCLLSPGCGSPSRTPAPIYKLPSPVRCASLIRREV